MGDAQPAEPLLDVRGIAVAYGNIVAVHDVSLTVREREIVTMIGANGAGKSTTLRTISGLLRPTRGEIRFGGKRIDEMPAHDIVRAGVSHAPEGRHVFNRLTVRENLAMGAFTRNGRTDDDLERVYDLFPVLKERETQAAGSMSGGQQQMLAIGRALMAAPKLLLLDEPSLGLAPVLVERIYDTLRAINEQGTTILLVEQNANMALDVAHRGYVLETGRVVLHDTTDALRSSPEVQRAYLGVD